MKRRDFIAASIATGGVAALAQGDDALINRGARSQPAKAAALKGRLKQSVCRWCYGSMALEELCKQAAAMGVQSVELLNEKEWSVPAQYGLTCAVANGPTSIGRGFNRLEHHDEFVKESERLLPLVKAAGIPSMIVFSGNRDGLSDAEGARNCITGLKRITPLAEKLGVTIVMELLNSKVDHGDYQCDRTPWGVEVVKGVGSPRFKLLYDIYHMQIMEGDVIRTIRDNLEHIAHFHTGGVPGRREIDQSQELNYPAICRAIVESGFTGYLAQEFIPSREPIASLREAVQICDV
ncbi:MAG: TIM barrel protein [Phycisphaerales bacterium]|nr:TIM barrel protein [Phycisphaerales bacterium]